MDQKRRFPVKAILLDGSNSNDRTGERVRTALEAQLQARGWEVEHYALCEKRIGNCAGDFLCWIRTPGMCNVNDDNRHIAAAVITSDLMVFLSPITFGGYNSTLKGMVDHLIQNVSPFFAMVDGETHHQKRYENNPDLLAVGWMEAPEVLSETVFRHLVQRNAINWHAKTWVGDVVLAGQSDDQVRSLASQWVDDIQNGKSSPLMELPANGDPAAPLMAGTDDMAIEVQRALLLVGSPKTRKSTSNSLGGYLFEQLSARSIQTEKIDLHTVLRNPRKMQALLDAVEKADLVTLAFPIYVDTLPAPVIEALNRITMHLQERKSAHRQMFAAIANCGFPEAHQCANALAVCEIFAQQAGFVWAGSLALGAGEAVNGASLAELGGQTMRMRQSLELAAGALAQGLAIPLAARDGLAKPVIPDWLYRLTGWLRWNRWAKRYDVNKLLKRQPYLAKAKSNLEQVSL
jgi:multimeric flavodoxin WrbA